MAGIRQWLMTWVEANLELITTDNGYSISVVTVDDYPKSWDEYSAGDFPVVQYEVIAEDMEPSSDQMSESTLQLLIHVMHRNCTQAVFMGLVDDVETCWYKMDENMTPTPDSAIVQGNVSLFWMTGYDNTTVFEENADKYRECLMQANIRFAYDAESNAFQG